MEEKIYDGGPAFPRRAHLAGDIGCEEWVGGQKGMSQRDYFAAQALIGLISIPCTELIVNHANPEPELNAFALRQARQAYRYADAMLKERVCNEAK